MPLFVKQGGSWRESPKGYTFAPKRFPGEQGPDFSFEGVRYRSFFNDGNTNAPVDVDSGGGAYDKDWIFAEHSFTFREGVPIRFEWFLGSVKPSGYQYSDSGTMILRAWVAKAGATRGFNTFGSRNNGAATSSLDGMQRVYQKSYYQNIPWGGGIFDFQTNTTISPQRIRELIPDVYEGMNLKLYFSVHIRRFGSGPSVHVRGQRLRVYELVQSVNRYSSFRQIWIAKNGQWRPLWIKKTEEFISTASSGNLAGRFADFRHKDHDRTKMGAILWGSAIVYMVDWNSGDPVERGRPITGIRLRIKTEGGRPHGMEVRVGSYQDFERRGVIFQHIGAGRSAETRSQHDRVNASLPSLWGNNGVHHIYWNRWTTTDSPWLDCHVPVGESLTIILQSHFGQDPGDANDIGFVEIIDVRYG